jgi:23S rRNA (cytosine1962-C5)-methyltransferase
VDIARDYSSLFKPAVLATTPGGRVLATNHLASVDCDEWIELLRRCAKKAGRPLRDVELLRPEADFPSFDGRSPLKLAVCTT